MNFISVDQNMSSIKFRLLLVTWTFYILYSNAVFHDPNLGRETILYVLVTNILL